jgi:hypothetical protein
MAFAAKDELLAGDHGGAPAFLEPDNYEMGGFDGMPVEIARGGGSRVSETESDVERSFLGQRLDVPRSRTSSSVVAEEAVAVGSARRRTRGSLGLGGGDLAPPSPHFDLPDSGLDMPEIIIETEEQDPTKNVSRATTIFYESLASSITSKKVRWRVFAHRSFRPAIAYRRRRRQSRK